MPNTKSAIRRVRRVKKQTQVNRIRKSKYKNAVKKMELLLKEKDKSKANKFFSKFQSILMQVAKTRICLLYTSPSPRDQRGSRMPSSA